MSFMRANRRFAKQFVQIFANEDLHYLQYEVICKGLVHANRRFAKQPIGVVTINIIDSWAYSSVD